MNEMTIDQALSYVALAEALEWLTDHRATVRFYDHADGLRVRVAVHNGKGEPDDITFALIPLADSDVESLAISLTAAREVIEPRLRRQTLHIVT